MLSNLYFRNRRLLVLTLGLILVSGLSSFVVMPRMEDPELTQRAAKITTYFPGADASRVEILVSDPLEEELREIEQLKEIRSVSRAGVSAVFLTLNDDVQNVDDAWSRIRNKMDDAAAGFPSEARPPEFEDIRVRAYTTIVALVWAGEQQDPNYAILRRSAERLKDRLLGVAGTEQVDLFGDPDEEILVELNPAEAGMLGLTSADVARQLEDSDAKVAAGQLRGRRDDLLFEVDSELDSLERIARTPIRVGGEGRVVQLADVAAVRKRYADPPGSLSLVEGRPAVTLGVLMRSRIRVDHWTADIEREIGEFRSQLPGGVDLTSVYQQNQYVSQRFAELLQNLGLGAVAVVLVVLVMMGWRNALIVGGTLPLAAMMVLAGMRLLQIPIHQMSVTGLIIALGLLIDNAIVAVDEVTERLRGGTGPAEAVAATFRHLAVPLLGSTVTTALAFAPIALMPGPAGEFVGSIAISVILAVFSSLFLSLTVVPAIAAMSARWGSADRSGWWRDGLAIPQLTAWYQRSLAFVFARPAWGLVIGMTLPVLGFWQAGNLAEQFFPPAERDQFHIELELPASASLNHTLETARRVREVALELPEVQQVDWFLGESAPTFYYNLMPNNASNSRYAQGIVRLRADASGAETIRRLQSEVDRRVADARVLVRQLEQGPPFDAPIEVRLYGPDLDVLRSLGDQVRLRLTELPYVIHTKAELSEPLPKLRLAIDEEEARLAGLNHAAVARQLNSHLEGALGGSVLEGSEELPVRVRVADSQRSELDEILSLDVLPGTASQARVPLSALARVRLEPEVAALPRFNGRRMNEVKAYLEVGVLPSEVLAGLQQRLDAADFPLPPGYSLEYGGEAAKRDDAVGNLMANVGVLAVLMVATLVLSLGSFRLAGIIGVIGTLAAGLGLGGLWIFGYPFGFMAIVGTMGLIGVAINDAIVVLAAIRQDEAARQGDPQAIADVVLTNTRHVLATTFTTMAGFAPLVLGGGGFWPPLAVAIAGGVSGATLLALYFGPAAYRLLMCPQRCRQLLNVKQVTTAPRLVQIAGKFVRGRLQPIGQDGDQAV